MVTISNIQLNQLRKEFQVKSISNSTIVIGTHFKAKVIDLTCAEVLLDIKGISGQVVQQVSLSKCEVSMTPHEPKQVTKKFDLESYLTRHNIVPKTDRDGVRHADKRWFRLQTYTLKGKSVKQLMTEAVSALRPESTAMRAIVKVHVDNWLFIFERAGVGFMLVTLYPKDWHDDDIRTHSNFNPTFFSN